MKKTQFKTRSHGAIVQIQLHFDLSEENDQLSSTYKENTTSNTYRRIWQTEKMHKYNTIWAQIH